MAGDLTNQTTDGTGLPVLRAGGSVRPALMEWVKTDTGTCTLRVISSYSGAIMGTVDVPTDNPSRGYFDFSLPHACYIEMTATVGSVSVNASIDGSASG